MVSRDSFGEGICDPAIAFESMLVMYGSLW